MNNSCEKNIDCIISVLNDILKQVESALCKIDAVSAEVIGEAQSVPEKMRSIELFKETDRILGELGGICSNLYEASDYIHKALPLMGDVKWGIENKIIGAASCRTSESEHRKDGNS